MAIPIKEFDIRTVATPHCKQVTPSDSSADEFEPSLICVMTGGTIVTVSADGNTIDHGTVADKTVLFGLHKLVKSTGTTADDIIRGW